MAANALQAALCGALQRQEPNAWDDAALDQLLEVADTQKADRDPLALKQILSTLLPDAHGVTHRQRKAVFAALDAHLQHAELQGMTRRFEVAEIAADACERRPVHASVPDAAHSRVFTAGSGDGYAWTQSEADLSVLVPVPEGTGKNDIALQMTPRFGPAQRLLLHCRFWPSPLLSGELYAAVEASECMWHLSSDSEVVVDLPKISEGLWPSILAPLSALKDATPEEAPRVAAAAERPRVVANAADASAEASAETESTLGVANIIQRIGQRPQQPRLATTSCDALLAAIACDDSLVVHAVNARALPVLIRTLRLHGQRADVQRAVWTLLEAMCVRQPFVKKLLSDAGAMRLVTAALTAHLQDEALALLLLHALKLLLPLSPPRVFVDNGGVELIGDVMRAHADAPQIGWLGAKSLQMLCSLNNTVRRLVMSMGVLSDLNSRVDELQASDSAEGEADAARLREAATGLCAQATPRAYNRPPPADSISVAAVARCADLRAAFLARGDGEMRAQLLAQARGRSRFLWLSDPRSMSAEPLIGLVPRLASIVETAVRAAARPSVEASEAVRALGLLCATAETAEELVRSGVVDVIEQAHSKFADDEEIRSEVEVFFELAVGALCASRGAALPQEELGVTRLAQLVRSLCAPADAALASPTSSAAAAEEPANTGYATSFQFAGATPESAPDPRYVTASPCLGRDIGELPQSAMSSRPLSEDEPRVVEVHSDGELD